MVPALIVVVRIDAYAVNMRREKALRETKEKCMIAIAVEEKRR